MPTIDIRLLRDLLNGTGLIDGPVMEEGIEVAQTTTRCPGCEGTGK